MKVKGICQAAREAKTEEEKKDVLFRLGLLHDASPRTIAKAKRLLRA